MKGSQFALRALLLIEKIVVLCANSPKAIGTPVNRSAQVIIRIVEHTTTGINLIETNNNKPSETLCKRFMRAFSFHTGICRILSIFFEIGVDIKNMI